MRCVLLTLAALAMLGLVGAGAVVGLGLYNVSARAGHWPGVPWVLHTTYNQSVRLRAPSEGEVPDLTAPGLAELGAGHFESACVFCHATPDTMQTATATGMKPRPPHVTDTMEHWDPRHLHWILQEGVKMGGMPQWPAARADEPWAVVAYLERVRAGTAPDVAPPTELPADAPRELAYCATCHNVDGRSDWPQVPRLDILDGDYMASALSAYRDGIRGSGFMQQAATAVPEPALAELAAWFAAQDAAGPGLGGDAALVEAGEELARQGTGEIPACIACHGPDAREDKPAMPDLAGQHATYLRTQLHLWRDGGRGGGARANLMVKAAQDLTDADIDALAAWYASLPPGGN